MDKPDIVRVHKFPFATITVRNYWSRVRQKRCTVVEFGSPINPAQSAQVDADQLTYLTTKLPEIVAEAKQMHAIYAETEKG